MHTYRWESHVQPPRTPRPPKVALVSDIGNRRLPCSPRRITLVGLLLLFLFVAFGIKTSGYFVCRFVVLVYRAGDRQELSSQGNYRSHYQSQLTKARRLEQGSTSKCVCGDIYHYTYNIQGLRRYLITFRKLTDDNIRLLSVLHP